MGEDLSSLTNSLESFRLCPVQQVHKIIVLEKKAAEAVAAEAVPPVHDVEINFSPEGGSANWSPRPLTGPTFVEFKQVLEILRSGDVGSHVDYVDSVQVPPAHAAATLQYHVKKEGDMIKRIRGDDPERWREIFVTYVLGGDSNADQIWINMSNTKDPNWQPLTGLSFAEYTKVVHLDQNRGPSFSYWDTDRALSVSTAYRIEKSVLGSSTGLTRERRDDPTKWREVRVVDAEGKVAQF